MSDWIEWDSKEEFPRVPFETPVRVKYRGAEDPAKGIRIPFSQMVRFDWSHDGGPDDIIAYRIEEVP